MNAYSTIFLIRICCFLSCNFFSLWLGVSTIAGPWSRGYYRLMIWWCDRPGAQCLPRSHRCHSARYIVSCARTSVLDCLSWVKLRLGWLVACHGEQLAPSILQCWHIIPPNSGNSALSGHSSTVSEFLGYCIMQCQHIHADLDEGPGLAA